MIMQLFNLFSEPEFLIEFIIFKEAKFFFLTILVVKYLLQVSTTPNLE